MVANNDIPDIMDSKNYLTTVTQSENPSDPTFLERAEYLHDHGFFKELTVEELRTKLHDLYRNKPAQNPHEIEDVWK